MNKAPLLGGIFLICGTSIGIGILGVPTATAESGFLYSTLTFTVCWVFTTVAALYLLEANLWLKADTNLISMSHCLLGKSGKWVSWILNLSLLYALICLYILAGSSWLSLFANEVLHINLSSAISPFLFLIMMGAIIYGGIRSIDKINRWLTILFLAAFAVIIGKTMSSVDLTLLESGNFKTITASVPTLLTAFGYSIILPAISPYYQYDHKRLNKMIMWGSSIALAIYIIWELITLGTIPLEGEQGLLNLAKNHDDGTGVIRGLESISMGSLSVWMNIFVLCIVITSFIGVSLALYHFLKDGLNLKDTKTNKTGNLILMYGPPIGILLLCPAGFHQILRWSGAIVAIYLGILPILMVWNGRYRLQQQGWKVPGGKMLLIISLIFYGCIVIQEIANFST